MYSNAAIVNLVRHAMNDGMSGVTLTFMRVARSGVAASRAMQADQAIGAAQAAAGLAGRPTSAVGAARRLLCGARSCGPAYNSLRELCSLRSDTSAESDDEARCARDHMPCAPRRSPRPPRQARRRLRGTVEAVLERRHPRASIEAARPEDPDGAFNRPPICRSDAGPSSRTSTPVALAAGGGPRRANGADEHRRHGVGARSAHRHLTRGSCLSVAGAARAASFAAQPRAEKRSGVDAQRRPAPPEPAAAHRLPRRAAA